MRYTFTVNEFVSQPGNEQCPVPHFIIKKVDTCIRGEHIKLQPRQFVEIVDNLKDKELPLIFNNQDDLDEWLHSEACAYQWMGREDRELQQKRIARLMAEKSFEEPKVTLVAGVKPHDFLAETDGFHVKENAEQPAHTGAKGYTLGQLKFEDNNVKTAAASSKPRTAAIPPIAIMAMGAAIQSGADKYGPFNWRSTAVTASVFYNAMLRHLEQWWSGEDHASDTGVHHLAHLMAGAAIVIDAEFSGVFIDDRHKEKILGDDYQRYYMKQPVDASAK